MPDSVGEQEFVCQLPPLRAEAADDAEQVTQALPGEPLALEERRGDWARVRTSYAYPGWLRAGALGGEADPRWLEPRAADPLEAARGLLGTPYEWGGMTEGGIDCSGLVHMSYRATGRLVPRDADQQAAAGTPVEDPRPGDLVAYGEPADHVAFWLGGGRILHATGREGVNAVVEEDEPADLGARRHIWFRF
jgi:hypothetical protein